MSSDLKSTSPLYIVFLDCDGQQSVENVYVENQRDEAFNDARAIARSHKFPGGTVCVQKWMTGYTNGFDVPLTCFCE